MSLEVLAALLVVGAAVGFVAGFIGIGGGVLMVPVLYFFFASPEWSGLAAGPEIQTRVAHATSLFVILPTAALGVWNYHRVGLVAWRAAIPVGIAATLAAVVGVGLATMLPGEVLRFGFGVLLIASGLRLIGSSEASARRRDSPPSLLASAITGIATGLLSSLLGVGGGIVAIPLLIYLVGLELERVAATSLVVVSFAAVSGTIGYVVGGWGVPSLPPGSLGYVHLASALPLIVGAATLVRFGTRVNQRTGGDRLRIIFALVFIALGLRLVVVNFFWFR